MLRLFWIFFFIVSSLHAREVPAYFHNKKKVVQEPWFTGPLISPPKNTYPPGHVDFEPYVYVTDYYGTYNSDWQNKKHPAFWVITMQPYMVFGITNWLDVFCYPTWAYQRSQGVGSWVWNDFPIGIDFQLLREASTNNYPSIKFFIEESFPTGKFDRLDPKKKGTDLSGIGSFGRLFHIKDEHWLNLFFSYTYFFLATKVHVKGLNAFGGGSVSTKGVVYTPKSSQFDFAFEFALSRNWAIACDLLGLYTKSTKFKGHFSPSHKQGFLTIIGSKTQYTIAPALEYNWSPRFGAISGVWMTFAGRNSQAYISWVTAVNCVF
jgi:hypothetical protein